MLTMRELRQLAFRENELEDEEEEEEERERVHGYAHSLGLMGGDSFYDRTPWFRLIGR